MAGTGAAIACFLAFLAFILSLVAVAHPLWAHYATSADTNFSTGLWEFCVNINVANASAAVPSYETECFTLRTPNNSTFVRFMPGVCSLRQDGPAFQRLVALGPNADVTRTFIERSCSALGTASMTFTVAVPVLSFILFIRLLVYGAKAHEWFGYYDPQYTMHWTTAECIAGTFLLTCASSFLSVGLWVAQAPATSSFGPAFYLELTSALALTVAIVGINYDLRVAKGFGWRPSRDAGAMEGNVEGIKPVLFARLH